MPTSALLLRPHNSPDRRVLRTAERTLHVLVLSTPADVQASLVERVFAQEMHGGQIERGAARRTARRRETRRFGC